VRLPERSHESWFAEDGNLALDSHELWEEPPLRSRFDVSRTLHGPGQSDSFPTMPRPPQAIRAARRARRPRRRQVHAGRRLAVLTLILAAAGVTVALAALGPGDAAPIQTAAPAQASRLLPSGPPSPQVVALAGTLRVQMPIAQTRVAAIGYHGGTPGALALDPVGTQANQGLFQRLWHRVVGDSKSKLRWYQLSGGTSGTSALDIGAAAGTVVGLSRSVLNGKARGARLEIQPVDAPSTVVVLTRIKPDPSLTVGASVIAVSTKLGVVLDLSRVERQALARFTNDAGNHLTIELHAAATLAAP